MTRTRVGVGVVVLDDEGRILLVERRGAQPRVLAVPGGRLEGGESVEECAARELAEETGLELIAGAEPFAAVLVDGWVVVGVRGRAAGMLDEREPDKVGGFRWVDSAALPDGLYPATAALLERL